MSKIPSAAVLAAVLLIHASASGNDESSSRVVNPPGPLVFSRSSQGGLGQRLLSQPDSVLLWRSDRQPVPPRVAWQLQQARHGSRVIEADVQRDSRLGRFWGMQPGNVVGPADRRGQREVAQQQEAAARVLRWLQRQPLRR